jgi:hypothetical protein
MCECVCFVSEWVSECEREYIIMCVHVCRSVRMYV